MKTLAIGSLFVLFAIGAGVNAVPSAFADHATAEVQVAMGSSLPGCEETNECYTPYEVTVDVGGEVTWINDDAAHTVTAGDVLVDSSAVGLDYPNGFDSSLFMSGNTFSHKFEVAGTYPYFCTVHPWMTGIVHVEDTGDRADDHMDDHPDHMDDSMMMMPSSIDQVMATVTNLSDGEMGSPLSIEVKITDLDGNALEHVNFMVTAMQDGQTVLESEEHAHKGMATLMTAPLSMDASESPVSVTVDLVGFGIDEITGPSGQIASSQIVPEFGTIAVMILGIAVVSIVALSAKSRVIPRM